MATSKRKQRKRLTIPRLFLSFAAVGMMLFLAGTVYLWHERTKYSFAEIPPDQFIKTTELPIAIDIPTIQVSLSIDEGYVQNNVWQISEKHATHLYSSASPGEAGNIVIYGHNKPAIFGSLHKVKVGDRIVLTSGTGQLYHYVVTRKMIVSPTQVDVIKSYGKPLLTIYTCAGLFDSQRLVLQADPV